MTINHHIAKRFALHYFVGIPVWIGAWYGLSFVSQEPKPLAVALMMMVIGFREIFDANQLAKIRGDLLWRILKRSDNGVLPGENGDDLWLEIEATFHDPRYTLKKSMWDLVSWSLGIATAVWVMG